MNTDRKYHSCDYSFSISAIQKAITAVINKPTFTLQQDDISHARHLLRAMEIMRDYHERALEEEIEEREEKARSAAQDPAPF